MCARSASSVSRSISTCIHDSTIAPSGTTTSSSSTATTSSSVPRTSRFTTNCGWITRCMLRPWTPSDAVTESTRNGMSSVTISMTV